MNKIISYLILVAIFLNTSLSAYSATSQTPKFVEVYEDNEFSLLLDNDVKNTEVKKGDEFAFTLQSAYVIGKETIIPKGTKVIAVVTHKASAGRPSHAGIITYKIKEILLPSGELIPIKAKIFARKNKAYYKCKHIGNGSYFGNLSDNFHDNYEYYNRWAYRPEYYNWAYTGNMVYNSLVAANKPTTARKPGEYRTVKGHLGRYYTYRWVRMPNLFQWFVILYSGVAKVVRTPIAFVTPLFKKGENITLLGEKYNKKIILKKPIIVPVYPTKTTSIKKVNNNHKTELKEENITEKDNNSALNF